MSNIHCKRCLLLLFSLLLLVPLFSQQPKDLERDSSTIVIASPNPALSLGLIESLLGELKDITNKKKLFDEILNFNDLSYVNTFEFEARQLIRDYDSKANFEFDPEDILKRGRAAEKIQQHDLLLLVRLNEQRNVSLYEFSLYGIIQQSDSGNRTEKLFWRYIDSNKKRIAQAEIYPGEDMRLKLLNALKDLFPAAHTPPIARIAVDTEKLNGKLLTGDSLNVAMGQAFHLDAFSTRRAEISSKLIQYEWRLIWDTPVDEDQLLPEIRTDSISGIFCTIVPRSLVPFEVELRVTDGVQRTATLPETVDTLTVIPFLIPEIKLSPQKIFSKDLDQVLSEIDRQFLFPADIVISNSSPNSKVEIDFLNVKGHTHTRDSSTIIVKLFYPPESLEGNVRITTISDDGIRSYADLMLNHKQYQTLQFTTSILFSRLEVASVPDSVLTWLEPRLMLFARLNESMDFGIGHSFQSKDWLNSEGVTESLRALLDLELRIQLPFLDNVTVTGFSKIFESKGSTADSLPVVLGANFELGLPILQGLADINLHFGLGSFPLKGGVINKFRQWGGISFRLFLPK